MRLWPVLHQLLITHSPCGPSPDAEIFKFVMEAVDLLKEFMPDNQVYASIRDALKKLRKSCKKFNRDNYKYAEADARARAAQEAAGGSGGGKDEDLFRYPQMTEEERKREAQRKARAATTRAEKEAAAATEEANKAQMAAARSATTASRPCIGACTPNTSSIRGTRLPTST